MFSFGDPRLPERFWDKVAPEPNTGCWLWTRGVGKKGYARFNLCVGKNMEGHRLVAQIVHSSDLKGVEVCHSCDTPSCVNPAHLFLGSHHDNLLDAAAKGRISRGERHYNHVLTEAEVLSVRKSMDSLRVLALRYRVSVANLSMIRNRKRWAWL